MHLTLWDFLCKMLDQYPDIQTEMMQSRRGQCITTVQELADEILAGVPTLFHLNEQMAAIGTGRPRYWGDGLRLLWPLSVVAFGTATRQDQKRAAVVVLHRIGRELGIQQAAEAPVPALPITSLRAREPRDSLKVW